MPYPDPLTLDASCREEQNEASLYGDSENAGSPLTADPAAAAQAELEAMIEAARAWNITSPAWNVENQCHNQAIGLMVHLRSLQPKLWTVDTAGGFNGNWFDRDGAYHHVTLLDPKEENPLERTADSSSLSVRRLTTVHIIGRART